MEKIKHKSIKIPMPLYKKIERQFEKEKRTFHRWIILLLEETIKKTEK